MKLNALLLALFTLLALYGCGGSPAAPTATPVAVKPTATTAANPTATPGAAHPTATTGAANPTATAPGAAAPTATAAGAAVGGAATDTPAGGAVTGPTTTPMVIDVAVTTPPPSVTLSLTPPALPAASTFSGTPGTSADKAAAVSVPVTITAKLMADSDTHWYSLDLTKYKGGMLVLDFSVPKTASGEMRMELYDSAGANLIDAKNVGPATTDQLVVDVKSGTYTLQVLSHGGTDPDHPYTLAATFHPNGANADKTSAVPLGLVATAKGLINGTSDQHWYAIDMSAFPQGGKFTVTLAVPAEAKGQYRLTLMDAAGANGLDSKNVDQGSKDSLTTDENAATNYYVVVESHGVYDWQDPYVLTTSFAPHSAYAQPKQALTVTPPVLARVHVASANDAIYLSFTVSGAASATALVSIPNDGNPTRLEFAEASGQNVYNAQNFDPGQQASFSTSLPNAGTYLLVVRGHGGEAVTQNPITIELRTATTP